MMDEQIEEAIRARGNWAYLQLREAVTHLLCYENCLLEAHGGSKPLPPEQSGVRLYQAKVLLYKAMFDADALCKWVEAKYKSEPVLFFEWAWSCPSDVRQTIYEVLMRIDGPLTRNLSDLLCVRAGDEKNTEENLKDIRSALEIERNSLHRGSVDPNKTRNLLMDFVWLLAIAYAEGRHDSGVLNRGVVEETIQRLGKNKGFTYDAVKKMWLGAKEKLDGQKIRGRDGVCIVLRTSEKKIRFAPLCAETPGKTAQY